MPGSGLFVTAETPFAAFFGDNEGAAGEVEFTGFAVIGGGNGAGTFDFGRAAVFNDRLAGEVDQGGLNADKGVQLEQCLGLPVAADIVDQEVLVLGDKGFLVEFNSFGGASSPPAQAVRLGSSITERARIRVSFENFINTLPPLRIGLWFDPKI